MCSVANDTKCTYIACGSELPASHCLETRALCCPTLVMPIEAYKLNCRVLGGPQQCLHIFWHLLMPQAVHEVTCLPASFPARHHCGHVKGSAGATELVVGDSGKRRPFQMHDKLLIPYKCCVKLQKLLIQAGMLLGIASCTCMLLRRLCQDRNTCILLIA